MRRSMQVLLVSTLLGVGTGALVHIAAPGPWTADAGAAARTTPAPTPRTTPDPSPSPSSTRSSVPTLPIPTISPASPTPTHAATGTPGPPFTRRALLEPVEFEQRGWVSAQPVTEYDTIPQPPITPCASVAPDQDGLVAAYAGTFASARTRAAEVVVRLDTERRAEDLFDVLGNRIQHCETEPPAGARYQLGKRRTADAARVDQLFWWTTRPVDGTTKGVIGAVRSSDRLLVISLQSDYSDPAQTTEIESLLIQAGRRLV